VAGDDAAELASIVHACTAVCWWLIMLGCGIDRCQQQRGGIVFVGVPEHACERLQTRAPEWGWCMDAEPLLVCTMGPSCTTFGVVLVSTDDCALQAVQYLFSEIAEWAYNHGRQEHDTLC